MSSLYWLRTTVVPLGFMLGCPVTVVLLWHTFVAYEGSLSDMLAHLDLATLVTIWPRPTLAAGQIVLIFGLLQVLLMVALPGQTALGPVTPSGNRVAYKINGLLAWVVTHLGLYVGAYHLQWFAPTLVYEHFGAILSVCSLSSLVCCGLLYIKGVWFPSSQDAGRSGNIVFDYYWGVELHPRLLGFDLKQYCIGR